MWAGFDVPLRDSRSTTHRQLAFATRGPAKRLFGCCLTRKRSGAPQGPRWAPATEMRSVCSRAMPLLFEVRFAFELHRCGVAADYEHVAGVGASSVEFRIKGPQEWLIELLSIRESQALGKPP